MNNVKFNRKSLFPNPKNKKIAIIILNIANLPSAISDGKHLATLFESYLKFDHLYIFINQSDPSLEREWSLKSNLTYTVCDTSTILIEYVSKTLKSIDDNADVIITLSSHGYANGSHNYFYFNNNLKSCLETESNNGMIDDIQLHCVILNNLSSTVRCLILIDTCQSGTMMNLPYSTLQINNLLGYLETSSNSNLEDHLETTSNKMVVCISATNDYQGDSDDISDLGFDGGLSASFIDYFDKEDTSKTIIDFYNYHCQRVNPTGIQPVLSYNQKDF
jgi:hypothetical protein